MMRLIACEMLRDEVELVLSRTGIALPVTWMEKGLHNSPDRLRAALQAEVDKTGPECPEILFAMACCGGAMDGLYSQSARLIVPRFDDCVRLLLAVEPGQPPQVDCRCLYFTRAWLDSDGYLLRDFEKYREKYGPKKAKRIIDAMIGHYRGYRMIDTGAYDLAGCEAAARSDAAEFGLEYGCQRGTLRILQKLLTRQWDAEFVVAQPGEPLRQASFLHC